MTADSCFDLYRLSDGNPDYPADRMIRAARITAIDEGTNQVRRLVMTRHLLTGVLA